jgi:beta-lactamase class D OXA-2
MRILILVLLFLSCITLSHAQEKPKSRLDWGDVFKKLDAQGTIVVADERTGTRSTSVYDEDRAQKRYSPASTFKIPHTLFALDCGLVRDELSHNNGY